MCETTMRGEGFFLAQKDGGDGGTVLRTNHLANLFSLQEMGGFLGKA